MRLSLGRMFSAAWPLLPRYPDFVKRIGSFSKTVIVAVALLDELRERQGMTTGRRSEETST